MCKEVVVVGVAKVATRSQGLFVCFECVAVVEVCSGMVCEMVEGCEGVAVCVSVSESVCESVGPGRCRERAPRHKAQGTRTKRRKRRWATDQVKKDEKERSKFFDSEKERRQDTKEGSKHKKSKKTRRQCKCTKDNDPDWDGITSLQTTFESRKHKMGLSKACRGRGRKREGERGRTRCQRDQLATD